DAPIATYLPEWAAGPNPEWRRNVTLRHLLTHTSGLPPHKPYYETSKGKLGSLQARREVLAKIFSEPLTSEPGKQSSYSDLGFILLGEIVEQMTGESLDRLARERIFAPLGMRDSLYNPAKSLHARLFSTAADLAAFCQMLLNGGLYTHQRILPRNTIELFTSRQALAGGTRALGWTVPTEDSSSGRYFSARSYGHTGFSGTSIWI